VPRARAGTAAASHTIRSPDCLTQRRSLRRAPLQRLAPLGPVAASAAPPRSDHHLQAQTCAALDEALRAYGRTLIRWSERYLDELTANSTLQAGFAEMRSAARHRSEAGDRGHTPPIWRSFSEAPPQTKLES